MNLLPDTSAVIDGRISAGVADGTYDGATVLIPEAVVAELESQANAGVDTGWDGLAELQRLADLADEGVITVEYTGRRPTDAERETAASGGIDALIRDLAESEGATILTSDQVQSEVAMAKGLSVEYVAPEVVAVEGFAIEDLFDDETMSVHLRTGAPPMAKRGDVGEMTFETVREEPATEEELHEVVERQIVRANYDTRLNEYLRLTSKLDMLREEKSEEELEESDRFEMLTVLAQSLYDDIQEMLDEHDLNADEPEELIEPP